MNNLIARLEAAEDGSRELDAEIWCLVEGYEFLGMSNEMSGFLEFSHKEGTEYRGNKEQLFSRFPHYTTSIDAALTLVPEGWLWCADGAGDTTLSKPENQKAFIHAKAATPALALCAATLKARETMKENADAIS